MSASYNYKHLSYVNTLPLCVCVGCTGQVVVMDIFKPFMAGDSDNDSVAYFGECFMEEDKVIINLITIYSISVNQC